MVSKPASPGPNTATTPSKQPRSRKADTPTSGNGRAGSAGGILLEKNVDTSTQNATKPTTKTPNTSTNKGVNTESTSTANKPRRKPRKLNQDPLPAQSKPKTADTTAKSSTTDQAAASELDALKARVRGLEAKVEELYKSSSNDPRSARSPRRRGKGRKSSSSKEVPTLNSVSNTVTDAEQYDDEVEEAEEELVRLEDELDHARRDLELYRPRNRRLATNEANDDDIEEIPRDNIGSSSTTSALGQRQVTLSGSYRIPIPANVSVDDVKTIQSGVSAAQNVARSFLEQRRAAAAAARSSQPTASPSSQQPPQAKQQKQQQQQSIRPAAPKSTNSNLEVTLDQSGGKQSWGEWIGGYSMAISRAVSKIEHEAAMESQRVDRGKASTGTASQASPGMKREGAKRPPAKAKLSSEQVQGLMS